jgi:CRP-like cAMP-binding protein
VGENVIDIELMTVLKECSLFKVLGEEQLREVAEVAKLADFERGQKIVEQGRRATTFYVILNGLVEVRLSEGPLARLGKGAFFGEAALMKGSSYATSILAIRPTRCLALSGSELRSYPAIVVKVLEELMSRNQTIDQLRAGATTTTTTTTTTITTIPSQPPSSTTAEPVIAFKSKMTRLLFDNMVGSFAEDYMVKRLYLEQAGWRTIGELSAATKISRSTLYGVHGDYGPSMNELLSRGLIETRVFAGQRGRGGEILRARISYDKEPVKRYVDRVVLRRSSD